MKFLDYLDTIITESINDVGILKALFLAGSPYAGKSYVLSKISSGQVSPRIVNTDKFFEFFGNDTASLDKSKQLTKSQLTLYLNSMLPLVIDGTSANVNNLIRRQGLLESLGYDTGIVYIHTDIEQALERIALRKRKVNPDVVRKIYADTIKYKDFYKTKFNFYLEISNNTGDLTNEIILAAYRKSMSFFTSSLSNPIGQNLIDKMKASSDKYLIPNIYTKEYLDKIVDIWYRK